jgi:hypothetical protein
MQERLQQLETALIKADQSGNSDDAMILAGEIRKLRSSMAIDTDTGVNGEIRAGMGLAETNKDKISYLKQHYPDAYMKGDNAIVVTEDGKHIQANPNGLDWGDVAENGRIGAQLLGGAFGGVMGAPLAPATGGASVIASGALGAEIANQAYDKGMSWLYNVPDTRGVLEQTGDAAKNVALDMAIGKTADVALPLIGKSMSALGDGMQSAYHNTIVKPVQSVARSFNGSRPGILNEGSALEGRLGVEFMPGQKSGNKFDLIKENWLRGQAGSADVMTDIDMNNVGALQRYTQGVIDDMGGSKPTYQLGNSIETTFKDLGTDLKATRSNDWNTNIDQVKNIVGDSKFITYNNTVSEIDDLISQFSGVGTSEAKQIIKELEQVKSGMVKKEISSTGEEIASLVPQNIDAWHGKYSHFSSASAGQGNIFKDLDKGRSKMVATRLKIALDKDLEKSSQSVSGDAYDAFDTARKTYREQSQSLDALSKSPVGRLAGNDVTDIVFGNGQFSDKSGHAIYKKLISLDPGEMQKTVSMIRSIQDGEKLLSEIKASYLQEALDNGKNVTPSAGLTNFSTNKLVRGLEKMDRDQMTSLGFTSKEMQMIDDIKKVSIRLGDRTGFNFSGTNVSQEFGEFVTPETSAGMLTKLASGIARQLSAQKMALDMLPTADREAARRLMRITKQKPVKPASVESNAVKGALTGVSSDIMGVLAQ